MAAAAILKFTLMVIPVIIAYIRTKFDTASKSDVSVSFTFSFHFWENPTWRYAGKRNFENWFSAALHCINGSKIGLTVSTIGQTFRHAR